MVDYCFCFSSPFDSFCSRLDEDQPRYAEKGGAVSFGTGQRGNQQNVGQIPGRVPETLQENVTLSLSQTTARKGLLG
jgi:hypothetical protein